MSDPDCYCDGTGFTAMFTDVRGTYGNTATVCSYGRALLIQKEIGERLRKLPIPAVDDFNGQRERLLAMALHLSEVKPVACRCGVMEPDQVHEAPR